jgi:Tfp pilus assembly protein PilF
MAAVSDEPFVGRDSEQAAFKSALGKVIGENAGKCDEGVLVLVSGPGGAGKSALLRRFLLIAEGSSTGEVRYRDTFLPLFIDWQGLDVVSYASPDASGITTRRILSRVAAGLVSAASGRVASRSARKAFDDFYAQLAVIRQRRSDAPGANQGASPAQQAGAALAGNALGAAMTLSGVPGGPIAGQLMTSAYGTVADVVTSRKLKHESSWDDDELMQTLYKRFTRGVRSMAASRPLVIILDTCELLQNNGQLLRSLAADCGPRVCWVLGIRLEPREMAALDSEVSSYLSAVSPGRLIYLELSGFTSEDLHAYFSYENIRYPLTDAEITSLRAATGGSPLATVLAARMLRDGASLSSLVGDTCPDSRRIIRDLAERYLRHVSEVPALAPDLPLLQGLALLPDSAEDYGLLAALWGVADRKIHHGLRDLARRHDFVFSARLDSPRAVMHREIRDILRKSLRDEDRRASVKGMNRKAVDYLERRLRRCGIDSLERQLSQDDQDEHSGDWQASALGLLWHTFWIDPGQGVALLRYLYPPAAILAPDFAAGLSAIAKFQLGSPAIRATRLLRFLAKAMTSSDQDSIDRALDDLGADPASPGPCATDINRTVFHQLLCLGLRPGRTDAQLSGSISVLEQASYDLSLSPATQTGKASRTIAALVQEADSLGVQASYLQQRDLAVRAFRITAAWNPQDARSHGQLALAYAAQADADHAGTAFRRAIEVEPGDAEMHAAYGELMILANSGDAQGRREALNWAIEKSSGTRIRPLVLRGLIPQGLSRPEARAEAREYFERALAADAGHTGFQEGEMRAIAYAGLGRTKEADLEFRTAAPLWSPADKYRAEIYRLLAEFASEGARQLTENWDEILSEHPDAASPWGTPI